MRGSIVHVLCAAIVGLKVAQAIENPIEVVKEYTEGRELNRFNSYSKKFKPFPLRKCPKPIEGDKTLEDRLCATQSLDNEETTSTCGCEEVCHIWGDPHMSPFWSECSEVGMHVPGWYILYELPADQAGLRTPIRIEGKVTENGRFKFVTEVAVQHGNDIEECSPGKDRPNTVHDLSMCKSFRDTKNEGPAMASTRYPVYNTADNSNKIDVVLDVKCVYRNRRQPYLNITISIDDQNILAQDINTTLSLVNRPQSSRSANELPDSTTTFDDDFGICVDPLRYQRNCQDDGPDVTRYQNRDGEVDPFWMRENCRRPSGLADGEACSCKQSCAAYGDPHVYLFGAKLITGNDFMADVTDPEFRVLYSVNPYISLVAKVDHCAFITGFWSVIAKTDAQGKVITSGGLNKRYDIQEFDANKLCNDGEDVETATRKIITIPEMGGQHYTESMGGFNIGKFLVDSSFETEVVSRLHEGSIKTAVQSTSLSDVKAVINMGSVKAQLKCHITEKHRLARPKNKGTKYFNVCIERDNIVVESPPVDDAQSRLNGGVVLEEGPHVKMLAEIEKVLKSDGICAVGDIVNPNKRIFTYRGEGETEKFPYNPEVAKAGGDDSR